MPHDGNDASGGLEGRGTRWTTPPASSTSPIVEFAATSPVVHRGHRFAADAGDDSAPTTSTTSSIVAPATTPVVDIPTTSPVAGIAGSETTG